MRQVVPAVLLVAACGRIGFDPDGDAALDPSKISAVSAGGHSTYAIDGRGQIWAWGAGDDGGIGDGRRQNATTPTLLALTGVRAIDSNDGGALARLSTGELVGWGPNAGGQLGAAAQIPQLTPAVVTTAPITSATMGDYSICVLYPDATVGCAGTARFLGDGAAADRASLGPVPGVTGVTQLIASDAFTCALLAAGAVTCWGDNTNGQLGVADHAFAYTPVQGPPGPYVELAVGDAHACGRRASGAVECWGRNTSGELGDATTNQSDVPVATPITDAIAITAAAASTCALRRDHTVACWGSNDNGQLARDRTTTPYLTVPIPIAGLADIVEITSRTDIHLCARDRDGEVYCWGADTSGEIGDGMPSDFALAPVRVVF